MRLVTSSCDVTRTTKHNSSFAPRYGDKLYIIVKEVCLLAHIQDDIGVYLQWRTCNVFRSGGRITMIVSAYIVCRLPYLYILPCPRLCRSPVSLVFAALLTPVRGSPSLLSVVTTTLARRVLTCCRSIYVRSSLCLVCCINDAERVHSPEPRPRVHRPLSPAYAWSPAFDHVISRIGERASTNAVRGGAAFPARVIFNNFAARGYPDAAHRPVYSMAAGGTFEQNLADTRSFRADLTRVSVWSLRVGVGRYRYPEFRRPKLYMTSRKGRWRPVRCHRVARGCWNSSFADRAR